MTKIPSARRVLCNRTLNMRRIRAVGFDMDYTLVHYHAERWEERAYAHAIRNLEKMGLPVDGLSFDPQLAILGLVIDKERGNLVKANRFGYVKSAYHGTRPLSFERQREVYGRELIDLRDDRWAFLNTLFGLSEACLYSQMVDRLDQGRMGTGRGYAELYNQVRSGLDMAHMEGILKTEIGDEPAHFVVQDPELVTTLLDLKHAGKSLMIITNSEFPYTRAMMKWAIDPWLPEGMSWRDLFDLVFVDARKPHFFTGSGPVLEVVDEEGLMKYARGPLRSGGIYSGGHASLVEEYLGLEGDQILYVGDHIFTDVNISKKLLRWRTALVIRDIEPEIEALAAFADDERKLISLMDDKAAMELRYSQLRRDLQQLEKGYGQKPTQTARQIRREIEAVRSQIQTVDEQVRPLAQRAGELVNPRWGLLTRTGNDKSHLARQIERYADIYLSRVSNLGLYGPTAFFRSVSGRLPHAR